MFYGVVGFLQIASVQAVLQKQKMSYDAQDASRRLLLYMFLVAWSSEWTSDGVHLLVGVTLGYPI